MCANTSKRIRHFARWFPRRYVLLCEAGPLIIELNKPRPPTDNLAQFGCARADCHRELSRGQKVSLFWVTVYGRLATVKETRKKKPHTKVKTALMSTTHRHMIWISKKNNNLLKLKRLEAFFIWVWVFVCFWKNRLSNFFLSYKQNRSEECLLETTLNLVGFAWLTFKSLTSTPECLN